ncbi:hypothetical protein, partial [Thermoleptolyngbya sp. M55_K2018_002]|uniref:hypothetical protein n=1 Tax=Thermoleptolyngbya sp. M55_K2018_002 TaxID=2747808 RepID=UPI001A09E80B
ASGQKPNASGQKPNASGQTDWRNDCGLWALTQMKFDRIEVLFLGEPRGVVWDLSDRPPHVSAPPSTPGLTLQQTGESKVK